MSPRLARALRFALLALALAAPAFAQERREPPREPDMPDSLRSRLQELPAPERRRMEWRLRRMPPARRSEVFQRWERLTPGERESAVARARVREQRRQAMALAARERLGQLPPEDRRRFFERAQRWRQMDASERARMRGRLGRFGALSPAEQQALVDHRFAGKSDAERAQILTQLRAAAELLPPDASAPDPEAREGLPPAN